MTLNRSSSLGGDARHLLDAAMSWLVICGVVLLIWPLVGAYYICAKYGMDMPGSDWIRRALERKPPASR